MSMGGGGSSSSKVTQSTKVQSAPWSEFPKIKPLWDEFVDRLSGPVTTRTGGTTRAGGGFTGSWTSKDEANYQRMKRNAADANPLEYGVDFYQRLNALEKRRAGAKRQPTTTITASKGATARPSFQQMLDQDIDYLTNTFNNYHQKLTSIEQKRLGDIKGATTDYLGGLKDVGVPIQFGGKDIMTYTPPNPRNTLADILARKTDLANEEFQTAEAPLQRSYQFATQHLPNESEMARFNKIGDLATKMNLTRFGLPQTTVSGKVSGAGTSPLSTIGKLAGTGASLYGLGSGLGLWGTTAATAAPVMAEGTGAFAGVNVPTIAGSGSGLAALASNPATWAIGLPLLLGSIFD